MRPGILMENKNVYKPKPIYGNITAVSTKNETFGESFSDTAFIENVCQTEAKYLIEQEQKKNKIVVSQKSTLNEPSINSRLDVNKFIQTNASNPYSKRLLNKQKLDMLSSSLASKNNNGRCLISPKHGKIHCKSILQQPFKMSQSESPKSKNLVYVTEKSPDIKIVDDGNIEPVKANHLGKNRINMPATSMPNISQKRESNSKSELGGNVFEICSILKKRDSLDNDSIGNISHSFYKDFSDNNESGFEMTTFLSSENKLELSSWGLPAFVLKKYAECGITTMFPWQVECLSIPGVLEGQNLVYSAPTSAGKTLVAEIILLKRVLESGKKGIFILPFVSITREKTFSLQKLFGVAGIRVEGFMGGQAPPGGFQRADIAVCTIEKANNIVNRLIEEKKVNELGIIVVDELHMVGDPHRGYLLELLLTKLQYLSASQGTEKVQIVGMSATLPNLHVLAMWLKSKLYCTSFRPIPLVEMVKMGNTIYNDKFNIIRDLSLHLSVNNDTDHLVQLCLETVTEGYSTLVFCPTKAWCEKMALNVASSFFSIGKPDSKYPQPLVDGIRKRLDGSTLSRVIEALKNCPSGLDPVLAKSLAFGAAFHHAGLTFDERDIIEGAFRAGYLPVLIATSTLSAGVNLPARRVIIRSPNSGGKLLDSLTYKQMVGRAGRKGKDTLGESILMCNENEKHKALTLVTAQLPEITSCLVKDSTLTTSLKRAILEVVVSGAAKSLDDINKYWNCTLLAASIKDLENSSKNVTLNSGLSQGSRVEDCKDFAASQAIDECIKYLFDNELARCQENNDSKLLIPTKLGGAILASGLSPCEGLHVFSELQRARKCFVLENELHIIYQVTPVYVSDAWPSLDWMTYLEIWESLSPDMQKVGELVGVLESFIIRSMNGTVNLKLPKQMRSLAIHQRFFAALALHDLVHEVPLSKVVAKYGATKGLLQGLQQSASTFAGMVTIFCNRLGWHSLELLISQYQDRLQFGIQRDLCDLVRITLVNGQRARILFNAGLETVGKVAHSVPITIENILINSSPFQSAKEKPNNGAFLLSPAGTPLSLSEAAVIIVDEARQLVQKELGLDYVDWNQVEEKDVSVNVGLNNTTLNKRGRRSRKKNAKKRSRSGSLQNSSFKGPRLDNNCSSFNSFIRRNSSENECKLIMLANSALKDKSIEEGNMKIVDNSFVKTDACTSSSIKYEHVQNDKKSDIIGKNVVSDKMISHSIKWEESNIGAKEKPILKSCNSELINSVTPLESVSAVKIDNSISNQATANSKGSFLISKTKSNSCKTYSNSALVPDSQEKNEKSKTSKLKIVSESSLDKLKSNLNIPSACKDFQSAFAKLGNQTPLNNRKSINCSLNDSFDLFAAQVLSNSDLDAGNYPERTKGSLINSKIGEGKENIFSFTDSDKEKIMNVVINEDSNRIKMIADKLNSRRSSLNDDIFDISDNFDRKESTPKQEQERIYSEAMDSPLYSALCEELKFEFEMCKSPDINSCNRKKPRRISFREDYLQHKKETNIKDEGSMDCDSSTTSNENFLISESGVLSMTRSNIEKDLNEFERTMIENCDENNSDSFLDKALELSVSKINKFTSNRNVEKMEVTLSAKLRSGSLVGEGTSFDDFSTLNLTPGTEALLQCPSPNAKGAVSNKLVPSIKKRSVANIQTNISQTDVISNVVDCQKDDSFKMLLDQNIKDNNDSCIEPTRGLSIIDVTADDQLFKLFLKEWQSQEEFSISLACEKVETLPRNGGIGWKVCGRSSSRKTANRKPVYGLVIENSKLLLTGLAICWGETDSYFINLKTTHEGLQREIFPTPPISRKVTIEERVNGIKEIFNNSNNKVIKCWDAKKTLKTLVYSGLGLIQGEVEDPRVAAWMLDPTAKEKNIHNLVLSHCDHFHNLLDVIGSNTGYESLGITINVEKSSRLGAATESVLVFHLCKFMGQSLEEADMKKSWIEIEMPNIMIMSLLELTGIGFSKSQCEDQKKIMEEKLFFLQQEAFQLAGHPFSLSSSCEVSKVLYRELHIAAPSENSTNSARGRIGAARMNRPILKSGPTNKEALEKIKDKHPLPGVILEWRRLHYALTKFVFPLTEEKVFCPFLNMDRIFPVSYTFTATGRISFHDPNLQNINKDFEIQLPPNLSSAKPSSIQSLPLTMQHLAPLLDVSSLEEHTISLRHAIIAGSDRLLLAADYSQLELRLLAHLSGDEKLMQAMNSDKDVFKNIAAQINRIPIDKVTDEMRQQAKQVSYGIIYGMGEKSLGLQLNLNEEDANHFMAKFRRRFPTVQHFIKSCIQDSQKNGYVITMRNRRRYLPGLSSSSAHTKAQCERQAINTRIQGSAADVVKMATISINKSLKENFPDAVDILTRADSRNKKIAGAYLVLQLHDELIYEVVSDDIIQVAQLVKHHMENVCKLKVQLPVKLKLGPSWGTMQPFTL